MVANAQNELDGITLSGASFAPALAAPAGPMADGGLNCIPTISPMPVVNSDSDRVPDSVRITFPNCAFVQDSEADTTSGSIHLTDPTPPLTHHPPTLVFPPVRRLE